MKSNHYSIDIQSVVPRRAVGKQIVSPAQVWQSLGGVGKSIEKLVGTYFQVTFDQLVSPRREYWRVPARQAAMVLIRAATQRSLPCIGAHFRGRGGGRMDHTTVLHGLRRFEEAAQRISRGEDDKAFTRTQVEAVVAASTMFAVARFLGDGPK